MVYSLLNSNWCLHAGELLPLFVLTFIIINLSINCSSDNIGTESQYYIIITILMI